EYRHPDRLPSTRRHLLEGEGGPDLHILTPPGPSPPAAAPTPLAEEVLEPGEPAEVTHEDLEGIGEIEPAEPGPARPRPLHARVTVPVVGAPLVGVTEDLVGLRRLPELRLRLLRATITVGVVLEGQLAIGLLDLIGVRIPRDAQDLIVVAHPLSTTRLRSAPGPPPADRHDSQRRGWSPSRSERRVLERSRSEARRVGTG